MTLLRIPTARVFQPLIPPARDKAAHGGRGSGKSHFFAGLMVEDCLAEPGENGGEGMRAVCIREVQKDLAQSSKALIEAKIRSFGLSEADGFKIYRDVIRTPGDGLIIFKGMNDYTADSIKSLEGFKRGWWEEAHGATQNSINLYRPTMRTAGAQMWWSWNPRHKRDAVDAMFRGEEKPTGAKVVRANWSDNPWFTQELEQERTDCLRMKPEQYEHIWNGDYATITEGAYYAKSLIEARAQGRVGEVLIDPLMAVRAFWDIGGTGAKADATSIWICQFIGQRINVLAYYEARGQDLATHINWLRKSGYGNAECFLPHDGAHSEKVFDTSYEGSLRQAGFSVTVVPNQGRGAAMQRVEAGRRWFPRIWFDQTGCASGIDAVGAYHERKDEERGIGLGPNHDWSSHGADAFGLMCSVYEPPKGAQEPIRRNIKGL